MHAAHKNIFARFTETAVEIISALLIVELSCHLRDEDITHAHDLYDVTMLMSATVVGHLPIKILTITHLHLVLSTGLVLKNQNLTKYFL